MRADGRALLCWRCKMRRVYAVEAYLDIRSWHLVQGKGTRRDGMQDIGTGNWKEGRRGALE